MPSLRDEAYGGVLCALKALTDHLGGGSRVDSFDPHKIPLDAA
jgi:hypothetical protein